MDPITLRQITEIKYQERLDEFARWHRAAARQDTPRPESTARVPRPWTAVLRRLSLAAGR